MVKKKSTGDKTDPGRPSQNEGVKVKGNAPARDPDKFKFKSTGKPSKQIGGKEVSDKEFQQEKRLTGTSKDPALLRGGTKTRQEIEREQIGVREGINTDPDTGKELLDLKLKNELGVEQSEKTIIPGVEKGDIASTIVGGTTLAATAAVGAAGAGAIAAGIAAAPVALTGAAILGGIYLINEFVLSPSEIANWAAVDNVAGALNFESGEIVRAVKTGDLDKEQALLIIEQNIKTANNMKSEVVTLTQQNPKLWASSLTMRTSVDTAIEGMTLKQLILNQSG